MRLLIHPDSLAMQSTVRPEYDRFFWICVIICTAVATAIAVFLIYSAWRYRRRNPNELPSQLDVKVPVEVLWIGIPSLIFLGMFLMAPSCTSTSNARRTTP